MRRKGAQTFLYGVYLVIVTPILLEIAIRIWGYSERYIYDPVYMPFRASTQIPFVHKPFLLNARARSSTWFSTDSLGLRTISPHARIASNKTNEIRIAFVGNSTTFGQGVRTEEAFSFRVALQLREKAKADVRAFNYGVSGYSVKEIAATVEQRVFDIDPDVIAACISFDDFDTTRCGGVDQWGYNTSYRMSKDVDENSFIKRLLRPIHLAYVIRDVAYFIRHRNDAAMPSPEELSASVPSSYYYLQEMRTAARRRAVPFILVALPTSGWNGVQFTATLKQCGADSIEVLDVSTLGRDIPSAQFNNGKYDSHPSSFVHRRIAEIITGHLMNRFAGSSLFVRND